MASTTCAIAGERGSGKTTLVNALIREALRVDSLGDDDEEEEDADAVEEVRSERESALEYFLTRGFDDGRRRRRSVDEASRGDAGRRERTKLRNVVGERNARR